ncbi:hypothetical protein pEaSNUABM25_00236 [Erwinia phage pEa_SNUABM_25]|nr:hypothetical protein pEaSNUABM25_00236 [Erwinia phage pEa_SNUABM_25]
MFFKNPVGGIIPNFPIQHTIVDMERRVSELYGELRAAGCKVVQELDCLYIEVPHGVNVDPIMKRHEEMFTSIISKPGRLSLGDEDEEEI